MLQNLLVFLLYQELLKHRVVNYYLNRGRNIEVLKERKIGPT